MSEDDDQGGIANFSEADIVKRKAKLMKKHYECLTNVQKAVLSVHGTGEYG